MTEPKISKKDIDELEAIYNNKKAVPSTEKKEVPTEPAITPSPESIPIEQPPVVAEEKLAENIEKITTPISFDGLLAKYLEKKDNQIDDEALIKKETIRENLYSRMERMFDQILSDQPMPTVQPQQQPVPIISPVSSKQSTEEEPQKKKKSHKWFTPKVALAVTGLFGIAVVAITFIILHLMS